MPSLKLAMDIASVVADELKPENLVATAEKLVAAHPEAEETSDLVAEVLREELDGSVTASV